MKDPRFLTVEEVQYLHQRALTKYGGAPGLRDNNLLKSAVNAPKHTFGGEFLHNSLQAMAATYWYSLVQNHAFVDGNKRVGLYAVNAFLELNGLELCLTDDEAEEITFAIAKHELSKQDLIELLIKCVPSADDDPKNCHVDSGEEPT